MTYRTSRNLVELGTMGTAALAFLIVPLVAMPGLAFPAAMALGAAAFIVFYILKNASTSALKHKAYSLSFQGRETRIIMEFTERLGVCFTVLDLVEAMRDRLEKAADMGVILIKSSSWEPVYRSPSAAANDPRLMETLEQRFKNQAEGVCFVTEDLFPATGNKSARGFLVCAKGYHLFVLTRLCALIEPEAFRTLYGELGIYFDRVVTVSSLFEVRLPLQGVAAHSRDAESFLPVSCPAPRKSSSRYSTVTLVNVSGDYYDAIQVDEDRTCSSSGTSRARDSPPPSSWASSSTRSA